MNQPPILIFAQRYKAFFDATNDAIAVFNPHGDILDANPLLVQLTGYPFDELVSLHLKSIFDADDVKALNRIIQRVLKGKHQENPLECAITHRKGQRRYLEVSFSLLQNQYGYDYTLFAVMHDITQRKDIEADLMQQAEELQRVFDAVPNILMVMDERRRIRRMNRSGLATLGRIESKVLGRRIGDVLLCEWRNESEQGCGNGASCKDCSIHNSLIDSIEEGETIINIEQSIPHTADADAYDNSYYRVNCVPLETRGMRWCVVSLEDISAKKKAEIKTQALHESISQSNLELKKSLDHLAQSQAKLITAQKMEQIGLLASGLAHNLRTPLSGIKGYSQLLKVDLADLQELDFIIEEVGIMESIINNLMLKSRKDHQKSEEVINLNDLLKIELQFLSANMYFKHKVKKVVDLDPTLPSIRGVYSHFSQALLNIIQNALDAMYTSKKKTLSIKTYHDESSIFIEITDTGCGIPDEIIDQVFDDFFTTKPSTVDRKGDEPTGTGLGLGSTNQNIRQYGGRIDIQSGGHKGTKVTVIIPCWRSKHISIGMRVLIVDDSDTMVGMLSRMCEDFGAEVYGVTDGEKALDVYQRIKPDLIVTDMLMPGLTGPELMSQIREFNSEQKVIYITGYSENPEFKAWLLKEIRNTDFAALLRKPFELEEFHQLLHKMAGTRESAGAN
ncbi:PAS domain S-box protein [bacterium]|nr:PAS domain S-box protein [bacterium]